MTDNAHGVAAADLSDDDLRRELAHLHEKRHDMLVDGTADQFRHNVERTAELEGEFLNRFAASVPDAGQKAAALS